MAIVKTESIRVDGRDFTRKIKCNAAGEFSCDLPGFVSEALGIDNRDQPIGASMEACMDEWHNYVGLYTNRSTETNQVILYDINTDNSGGFRAGGLRLEVKANVYTEIITKTTNQTSYAYDHNNDDLIPRPLWSNALKPGYGGDEAENKIPATPENIQFFNDLATGLQRFIERLEAITETPDTIALFANSEDRVMQKIGHILNDKEYQS